MNILSISPLYWKFLYEHSEYAEVIQRGSKGQETSVGLPHLILSHLLVSVQRLL